MLIDFHTHLFPDHIAEKALPNLAKISGLNPVTNATMQVTLHKMDNWGVSLAVVLHIATNEKQQQNVNTYAKSINNERLISFGSVYPTSDTALTELDSVVQSGLKGIKLHPDYQGFDVDDPNVYPLYERLSSYHIPVVFHTGFDPLSPNHVHATPKMMLNVIRNFPNLKVICAHFGGMNMWNDTETYLVGKNVYFDTSMCASNISPEQATRIIKNHGYEKILFGSDCPWQSPLDSFEFIDRLTITPNEKDFIFYKNALRLLNLSSV